MMVDIHECSRRNRSWQRNYERLSHFAKTHGHCCVSELLGSENATHDIKFIRWIRYQTHRLKEHKLGSVRPDVLTPLRADRLQKLDDVGLFDAKWKRMFRRLVDYRERYGNVNVHIQYPDDLGLGQWLCNQRRKISRTEPGHDPLIDRRRRRLEDIGVVFDAFRSPQG